MRHRSRAELDLGASGKEFRRGISGRTKLKWDLAPPEELIEFVCENNKAQNMVGK